MELNRGTHVGRYRVVAPLGKGGMGVVFRATDVNLGRDVAIKFISTRLAADEEALRRFDREARLLASVNHPNVASIYGLEEENGERYIVMELVEGETLAERIARAPLSVADALDVMRQVTLGLEAAHEHGIIHRDIKPANIKITADGTVKVLDFGLAKTLEMPRISTESDTELLARTAAGVVVGTPMYMSPEQLRGGPLDARADIWAIGCVLFEALTGKRPFQATSYSDTVASIIHDSPDWSALPSTVPQYMRRIIERCLQKQPEARWSSARELRLALSAAWSQNSARPKWALIAVAAIAVLAVIAVAILATRRTHSDTARHSASTPTQFTVAPGVEDFPAWSSDGTQLAYTADVGPVRKIFLKRPGSTNETQLTTGPFDDIQPSWSPDGKIMVFQRARVPNAQLQPGDVFDRYESSDIWKIDVATRNEKKLLDDAYGPTFSPDGKKLAFDASFAGPRRIWISDATGLNPQQLTTDSTEAATHIRPRWSPDGRKIVFQRIERTKFDVSSVDVESHRSTALTDDAIVDVHPVWSAAGDAIYFSSPRGGGFNVWRLPADGKGQPEQVTFGAGQDVSIAVSPRSGQLAFVTLNQNADLWRLPVTPDGRVNGAPSTLVSTTREEGRGEWSPDGRRLAFNSDRGGDMNIWIMDLGSRGLEQLTSGPGGDYQPTWSRDGSRVTFFSSRGGNLDVWVADVRDKKLTHLTTSPAIEVNPFFSPDGTKIAYQSDAGGRLELWVMSADGSNARQITRDGVGGHFMRWMRGGSHILCRCQTGDARVSMLPVDGGPAIPLPHVKGGSHLSVSKDESKIADVLNHKTIWISPVEPGEAQKFYEFDDPQVRIDYPVWSPDGTVIVFDRFKPEGGDIWLLGSRDPR